MGFLILFALSVCVCVSVLYTVCSHPIVQSSMVAAAAGAAINVSSGFTTTPIEYSHLLLLKIHVLYFMHDFFLLHVYFGTMRVSVRRCTTIVTGFIRFPFSR